MSAPHSQNDASQNLEDDETDAILAELEAETNDTTSAAYQQRLNELQAVAAKSTANGSSGMPTANLKSNIYVDLKSDDETLRFTTEHEKAIVHFRHTDFARCAIMDQHLDRIAQRHTRAEGSGEEVVFAKVDVTNTPFIVEKLGVRVLPCVIGFTTGVVKGRIVGFEGICRDSNEKDARVTRSLEETLFSWGLLKQKLLVDEDDSDSDDSSRNNPKGHPVFGGRRGIRSSKQNAVDDGDDWD